MKYDCFDLNDLKGFVVEECLMWWRLNLRNVNFQRLDLLNLIICERVIRKQSIAMKCCSIFFQFRRLS